MKEDKKYSTYAYENGEKNQSRTLFMFANRYYPSDKSNDACQKCNSYCHIPPVIVKIKYFKYQNKRARSGNCRQEKGVQSY